MEPVLQSPATWSRRDVRRIFAGLPAPEPQDLVGRWEGAFVGRDSLRRTTHAIAATGPLRGWFRKEIDASGDVHNFVRRGSAVTESAGAKAVPGVSLLDGAPVVVVDYSQTASPPVSWTRGEVRWLSPGREILGVLLFPMGKLLLGPFPFTMTKVDETA